jgi:hypothetical protein
VGAADQRRGLAKGRGKAVWEWWRLLKQRGLTGKEKSPRGLYGGDGGGGGAGSIGGITTPGTPWGRAKFTTLPAPKNWMTVGGAAPAAGAPRAASPKVPPPARLAGGTAGSVNRAPPRKLGKPYHRCVSFPRGADFTTGHTKTRFEGLIARA